MTRPSAQNGCASHVSAALGLRWSLLIVLFALLAGSPLSAASKLRTHKHKVPGEYIVVFTDDVAKSDVAAVARDVLKNKSVVLHDVWTDALKAMYVLMTDKDAAKVADDPRVALVEENSEWALSSDHATYVDPRACDPTTTPTCPATTDNRLWHLDRMDQNFSTFNNSYRYRYTGAGVRVYVIDSGVVKAHVEFAGTGRVLTGFNATGTITGTTDTTDRMPADDPCCGFAIEPSGMWADLEKEMYRQEVGTSDHGTAVASALGGQRVGVAKGVTIVPVKVIRCDENSARARRNSYQYVKDETMFRPTPANGEKGPLWRARNAGFSDAADPYGSAAWPTNLDHIDDGQVDWEIVPLVESSYKGKTDMILRGVTWIYNNHPSGTDGIVTMSTYRNPLDPVDPADISVDSVETALGNLIADKGIAVFASANNQSGDACHTSPARLSDGNPTVSFRKGVITVGGSMIVNRPWAVGNISDVPGGVEANGDGKGTQPPYVEAAPVQEARWTCGKGDSAACSNAEEDSSSPNPALTSYIAYTGGSNGGPCVSFFAPAKNLFLASGSAANGYRDGRLFSVVTPSGTLFSRASGTSFSAPMAAGVGARILQAEPGISVATLKSRLDDLTVATQETSKLHPKDHNGNTITGTPNKFLRISDVGVATQPQSTPAESSGSTLLSVAATGNSAFSYQWYRINDGFNFATYKSGAQSSQALSGATAASYNAQSESTSRAYWVRVTNAYGSADSDFAAVVPRPTGAPSSAAAEWNGSGVVVAWSAGTGAEKYEIQRKQAGQPWKQAGLVDQNILTFTDVPSSGGLTSGAMAVYRVLSAAGVAYLPPTGLATSAPSNNDIANSSSHAYDLLPTPPTYLTIRAQHIIELRQAVNSLCDAVGASRQFTDPELALSLLQFTPVDDDHFVDLMVRINAIRTHSLIGMSQASFLQTPIQGVMISLADLKSLRDALK